MKLGDLWTIKNTPPELRWHLGKRVVASSEYNDTVRYAINPDEEYVRLATVIMTGEPDQPIRYKEWKFLVDHEKHEWNFVSVRETEVCPA